jgi:hypothetical protein
VVSSSTADRLSIVEREPPAEGVRRDPYFFEPTEVQEAPSMSARVELGLRNDPANVTNKGARQTGYERSWEVDSPYTLALRSLE